MPLAVLLGAALWGRWRVDGGQPMSPTFKEEQLSYPASWEDEYRKTGFVKEWRLKFLKQFQDHKGSTQLGTLDLFPQYALMFLLRINERAKSITWYKLADSSKDPKGKEKIRKRWRKMRDLMGDKNFEKLQAELRTQGFSTFKGEPDLFCWDPIGRWFFAEAKGKDKLTQSQLDWFQVCHDVLGDLSDIRVYHLVPDS
jgi:hypothetical protein